MARIYVDKYNGKIERTDLYHVRLIMKDGRVIEDLEPRRLFPISSETMFITLLDANEREIGFVRSFEEIDTPSREALKACLDEYYMIPKILRVLSVSDENGALKWTVETDHGKISFNIRNRNTDIKHTEVRTRFIIRDSSDNRYEIPDTRELDPHSLHLLFSYI